MINLNYLKNQKINKLRIVEVLFYTFPISFIVGNFALSLHLILFLISSLFLIQKKRLNFRFNNSTWILIIFFLYFFISTTIQFQSPGILNEKIKNWPLENNPIFKSFLLLRFLLLIFVIDTLFFNKIINLKKIFLSSLICTSFVSFDVILQYLTGYDILGLKKPTAIHNSGPFGDELIAGTYLRYFSFFSFFYILETVKDKKIKGPLLVFLISIHLFATLITGNRMQIVLFLFGCALIILIVKKLRFIMISSLLLFSVFFLISIKYDDSLKNTYLHFLSEINPLKIKSITNVKINKDSAKQSDEKREIEKQNDTPSFEIVLLRHTGYNRIFRNSIEVWKEKPLTGFGLKSFRIKCWEMLEKRDISVSSKLSCANHSHNYYLEFLSEAGIIGTSLLIIFFLIILKDSFYFLKENNDKKYFLIPIIISIFLEIWPLKSTGSFFTTWGSTFFWINVSFFLSARLKNS